MANLIRSANSSSDWTIDQLDSYNIRLNQQEALEFQAYRLYVCIVDRRQNDIFLLVQEDNRAEEREPLDARAQLVARALAAFTENNASRQSIGLPPLELKVVQGIVMAGTAPTFFKIPVTEELVTHVRHGTYPQPLPLSPIVFPPYHAQLAAAARG